MNPKWLWISIVLLLLAGLGFFWLYLSNKNKFDSDRWKAQYGKAEPDEHVRAGMVGALLRDRLREGMPRTEILESLGPPDFQRENKDYYALGRAAYGIDYEYLVIEYRNTGMARAYIERG